MRAVLRRVDRFWFAPAPARRLALLRILIGGYALQYLWSIYPLLTSVAGSSRSLFDPVGVAALLPAPIPLQAFRALIIVTLIANVLFLLGWRHRYSGPLFAGLLLSVLCYRNSWSMIYHSHNVFVLHILILGLTPAADALSLDALGRSRATGRRSARDVGGHWAYGYPIRLLCTVTVLTYFLAAVAKAAGPLGIGWATGEALRSQVAVDGLHKEVLGGGAPALAFFLFEHVWVFTVMGIASLATEFAAPLALLDRRLGYLWAFGAFLMHWGIYFVMGIDFQYYRTGLIFAPFFDLDRVLAWRPFRTARPLAVPVGSGPSFAAPWRRAVKILRARRLTAGRSRM